MGWRGIFSFSFTVFYVFEGIESENRGLKSRNALKIGQKPAGDVVSDYTGHPPEFAALRRPPLLHLRIKHERSSRGHFSHFSYGVLRRIYGLKFAVATPWWVVTNPSKHLSHSTTVDQMTPKKLFALVPRTVFDSPSGTMLSVHFSF